MAYKILANLAVLVHFLWILFLVFGALWGVHSRAVRYFHVGGLIFAFVINVMGWYCPLTYLEVWLRSMRSPGDTYAGSFIAHYLEEIIYLDVPERALLVLTIVLCAFNAWYYLRRRPRPSP